MAIYYISLTICVAGISACLWYVSKQLILFYYQNRQRKVNNLNERINKIATVRNKDEARENYFLKMKRH
ncbi:MAG: hypothetical protein RR316_04725 [Clostridia bacterium]